MTTMAERAGGGEGQEDKERKNGERKGRGKGSKQMGKYRETKDGSKEGIAEAKLCYVPLTKQATHGTSS